jgi:hypothetical protein
MTLLLTLLLTTSVGPSGASSLLDIFQNAGGSFFSPAELLLIILNRPETRLTVERLIDAGDFQSATAALEEFFLDYHSELLPVTDEGLAGAVVSEKNFAIVQALLDDYLTRWEGSSLYGLLPRALRRYARVASSNMPSVDLADAEVIRRNLQLGKHVKVVRISLLGDIGQSLQLPSYLAGRIMGFKNLQGSYTFADLTSGSVISSRIQMSLARHHIPASLAFQEPYPITMSASWSGNRMLYRMLMFEDIPIFELNADDDVNYRSFSRDGDLICLFLRVRDSASGHRYGEFVSVAIDVSKARTVRALRLKDAAPALPVTMHLLVADGN